MHKKFVFTLIIFMSTLFVAQAQNTNPPVFIYALVYKKSCDNSLSATNYVIGMSNAKNYSAEMKKLKEEQEWKHGENATVQVSSSLFEFSSEARHFYLISYKVKGTTCNQRGYIAKFGKTAAEAKEAAETLAKNAAENGKWDVEELRYW